MSSYSCLNPLILDSTLSFSFLFSDQPNGLDFGSIYDPYSISKILYEGDCQIKSDGLSGVVQEGIPVSALVVLFQEHQGKMIEVGRMDSTDGSWHIHGLKKKATHAVAFKAGFNAGVIANITPED
ncbi:MAG: hypothetical protein ACK4GA_06830 [Acinetobacter sp.]|uniref:hypothetical protein n=1 Tax=Acinetobacter sp. TaxID=472 RepID=UPI00391AB513